MILILRKNYHPIQLMQLSVAFFFGYLTDFGVWAVRRMVGLIAKQLGKLLAHWKLEGEPGGEA